jgi:serine/threonine-protein kinase RsbW
VADEGAGFDANQVPDPALPENRTKPGGRGVMLMREFMTWIRFNNRGNRVTMCMHRSNGEARSSKRRIDGGVTERNDGVVE